MFRLNREEEEYILSHYKTHSSLIKRRKLNLPKFDRGGRSCFTLRFGLEEISESHHTKAVQVSCMYFAYKSMSLKDNQYKQK